MRELKRLASLIELGRWLWVQRWHEQQQKFIDGSVGFAPASGSGNGTNRSLTSGSLPTGNEPVTVVRPRRIYTGFRVSFSGEKDS